MLRNEEDDFEDEEEEEWLIAAKQAISGALAGASTALLLHPLDTAKTFRQSDPARYRGIFPTLKLVAEKRGIPALYAGLIPAMFGSAPSSAVYFSMYEFSRRRLSRLRDSTGESVLPRIVINMVSAASGNIASSSLFVPKEVLKQRLQVGMGDSVSQAALILFRQSGVRGFYAGYFTTLMRNIPSTALKFVLYEEIKHLFLRLKSTDPTMNLSTQEHLLAGGLSGLFSSFVTTPMDVMKTKYGTGKALGLSVPQLVTKIFQEEGLRGFYVGLRPRLLWSALFASVGFASYETFKKILNTGNVSRRSMTRKQIVHMRRGIRGDCFCPVRETSILVLRCKNSTKKKKSSGGANTPPQDPAEVPLHRQKKLYS